MLDMLYYLYNMLIIYIYIIYVIIYRMFDEVSFEVRFTVEIISIL